MIRSEMADVSVWTSVFGVLPFEEHEQAMWALRIRYREKVCVHTLDLFGPRLTEEYRAGVREELHKTRKDVLSAPILRDQVPCQLGQATRERRAHTHDE